MSTGIGELIIAGLISAGVGTGATEGVTTATLTIGGLTIEAGTVGSAALLVGSVGLNLALTAGAQKQPKPASGLISIKQPNPIRQGVYGRARLAGSYLLYETVPPLSAQSIDVLAMASGQICGPRQFYLNDDAVTQVAGIVGGQADGRYAGSLVALDWRVGLPVETAYAAPLAALPLIYTADHRGDGVAGMSMSCLQTPTVSNQTGVFPNGLPNPSMVVDGYPIWDPRQSSQDPDDLDTWIAYATWSTSAVYTSGERVVHGSLSRATAYSGGTTYARYARVSFGGVDYYSRVDGNLGTTPGTNLAKWLPIGAVYYSRVGYNLGHAPDESPEFWCAVGSNPVLQYLDYIIREDHGRGLDRATLITPKLSDWMREADLCDELVTEDGGV